MTLDRLKKIFKTIKPAIDVDTITVDTLLVNDLGIDSLSMMLLALAIEDEFKFRFDTVTPFTSVGEVVNYIDKKVGE